MTCLIPEREQSLQGVRAGGLQPLPVTPLHARAGPTRQTGPQSRTSSPNPLQPEESSLCDTPATILSKCYGEGDNKPILLPDSSGRRTMLRFEKQSIINVEQKLLIGESIERAHQDTSNEFKGPVSNYIVKVWRLLLLTMFKKSQRLEMESED